MDELLIAISEEFEKNHIKWAVGASKLLSFYGITDIVNDLDLLVDINDHMKAKSILLTMGKAIEIPNKEEYTTESFSRFEVNNIEIDLMSNFNVKYDGGIFHFKLDTDVRDPINLYGKFIPVTSLEQWYIAYLLMKNRDKKVKMIEDYFMKTYDFKSKILSSYIHHTFPTEILDRLNNLN